MKAIEFPGYIDRPFLGDVLKKYKSPKSKITTMISSGELIRIKRGLYISSKNESYSLKTIANKIYGPSYISFEYALSYYGLIPERVMLITSAGFDMNKNLTFKTPVGIFSYTRVNRSVFPYGVSIEEEAGSPFMIASKEKAICDYLTKGSFHETVNRMGDFVYNDLRMDKSILMTVDLEEMKFLADIYKRKIISAFVRFIELEKNDA
jgi:predicted transcriptional regulator of viral defense system